MNVNLYLWPLLFISLGCLLALAANILPQIKGTYRSRKAVGSVSRPTGGSIACGIKNRLEATGATNAMGPGTQLPWVSWLLLLGAVILVLVGVMKLEF
jgi:hypothetical protein